MMLLRFSLCVLCFYFFFFAQPLTAEDWLRFRGPQGSARSDATDLPFQWSEKDNLRWRTPLPGFGGSSPILVGGRVFLTYYDGYGLDAENPGKEEGLTRHLVCLDRDTGEILWSRGVPAAQPEASYQGFMPEHGYATSTPTSDGRSVYAFFGKSGVHAYSLDGEPLWKADVGAKFSGWGSSGSLVLDGQRLIVNATLESYSVYALDKQTGEPLWRLKNLTSSWATPLVVRSAAGRRELIVSTQGKLLAVDPETGERLWWLKTHQPTATSSPIARGDVIYFLDDRPSKLVAVRAGGEGDVAQSHVLWTAENVGSTVTSPVLSGENIYAVSSSGIATCVHADTGELLKRARLTPPAKFYASPIAADGRLYTVSRDKGTFVLAAEPDLKQLAVNTFQEDKSIFNAAPAVSQGRIYLRSDRYVYCLEQGK